MVTPADDLRLAKIGLVLSDGVRAGEITESDARRIIVHDLRRGNANNKMTIRPRSVGAQRAIEGYAPSEPPKNGSDDALHADHYGMLTRHEIAQLTSLEQWVETIERIRRSVVCVTAAENYALMKWERIGHLGPEKYEMAGVEFIDPVPWETTEP
jgi:hypothetical protein